MSQAEVDAVLRELTKDRPEGAGLTDVAEAAVKAVWEATKGALKAPPSPLTLGMLFKTPWSATTFMPAWFSNDRHQFSLEYPHDYLVWVVDAGTSAGMLMPVDWAGWKCNRAVRPTAGRAAVPASTALDGTVTPAKKATLGTAEKLKLNDDGWLAGQRVSHGRWVTYKIQAVAPGCVLVRDEHDETIFSMDNHFLQRCRRVT